MKQAISNLVQLQEIDLKLDALEREKGDMPARVRALEEQRDGVETELNTTRAELEDVEKQRRGLEREIKTLQEHKKKSEEQLYAVQTNKEYDAVTQEIEHAVQKIDENETAELELIEREEALKEKISSLEEKLQQFDADLAEQKTRLDATIARNAEREKELQAQREQVREKIQVKHLRLYERIRKPKDGLPIVPVKRGACGGCYTQIPPQRIMEVRDGDKLIICESCGRMLYWEEQPEAHEEAA